jgi:8-oxo-dGTP pyrophosphatase MutT (NUDIX family)
MTETGGPVAARPAAAVVLAREPASGGGIEVFMVRRPVRSEFAPDAFVFPGGSVQQSDRDAERIPGLCAPIAVEQTDPTALGAGFRVAALRECFEEAGVLLARQSRAGEAFLAVPPAEVLRFAAYRDELNHGMLTPARLAETEGLTLATDALLHWAHWITPEDFPKRFDTHFFLAAMPAGQGAAHDRLETTDGVWIVPEDALARFERGAFPLVFATIHQLRALSGLASVAAARARFTGVPLTVMPRVVRRDGRDVILLPDEE